MEHRASLWRQRLAAGQGALCNLLGGWGKPGRGRSRGNSSPGCLGGAALARGDSKVPCVCRGGLDVAGRGPAGAACLRCIPRIPSLLPAPIGRGCGLCGEGGGWGGMLTAPAPPLEAMGGWHACVGHGAGQGEQLESSGGTSTLRVLLVPLALQGPVGIGCVRDAALCGGHGVPVSSGNLGQATGAERSRAVGAAPQGAPACVPPQFGPPEITHLLAVPDNACRCPRHE